MKKTKVNAQEIMRLKARLRKINGIPFEKIQWVNDKGKPLKIDQDISERFRFTGLNNSDFVECIIYGDGKMAKELSEILPQRGYLYPQKENAAKAEFRKKYPSRTPIGGSAQAEDR